MIDILLDLKQGGLLVLLGSFVQRSEKTIFLVT
jgi:hypothetical protein